MNFYQNLLKTIFFSKDSAMIQLTMRNRVQFLNLVISFLPWTEVLNIYQNIGDRY